VSVSKSRPRDAVSELLLLLLLLHDLYSANFEDRVRDRMSRSRLGLGLGAQRRVNKFIFNDRSSLKFVRIG